MKTTSIPSLLCIVIRHVSVVNSSNASVDQDKPIQYIVRRLLGFVETADGFHIHFLKYFGGLLFNKSPEEKTSIKVKNVANSYSS